MLELGGFISLVVFGVLLAMFTPDYRRKSKAGRSPSSDPLFQSDYGSDVDVTFGANRAPGVKVNTQARDTTFGNIGTQAFYAADMSHIRDFIQGTDILELYYAHSDGPMDLSLDPNRQGGTNVVLNGEVVAIVDNVMLMGSDVLIRPKLDPKLDMVGV